mmetsp:Transcript_154/g.187  ORF Transcript_154/g.187 Transcript_154/m.187 type:complete len:406 (-) Transcript_154:754-1971(-)
MAAVNSDTVFRENDCNSNDRKNQQYESGFTKRVTSSRNIGKDQGTVAEELTISKKYQSIEAIIMNPICLGYLLQFCTEEHNAENVNFLLAVDEYKDVYTLDRAEIWQSFDEIDKRVLSADALNSVTNSFSHGIWPSLADKALALDKIEKIVQKYLRNDASSQVCISEPLIKQTLKRINLLHLYGPTVFEESLREPIKTMKKDILPRYLVSEIFRKMVANVSSCEPTPPSAADLKVPPPDSRLLTISSLESLNYMRRFDLDEVLNCLQLYNEFLSFLRERVSSENLICVRMIDIFEDLMTRGEEESSIAGRQAWKIYQYFVAPGSAFEVSIHHIHRKYVMLGLAVPKKGMFHHIRRSVYETLKGFFKAFMQTDTYCSLGQMMRDQKLDLSKFQGGGGSSIGCFGRK